MSGMDTILPEFTTVQLAHILKQLQDVEVDGKPVLAVQIINAHNDRPIALKNIKSFGMVYLRISLAGYSKDFPMMVRPVES